MEMEDLKLLLEIQFSNDWWVLLLPVSLMAMDIVTGVIDAWLRKRIKSYRLREGLGKKFGELSAIIVGVLLWIGLGVPKYIANGISGYVIFMEIISIFENLDKLGVPIPKPFKRALGAAEDILDGDKLSDETKSDLKKAISLTRKEGQNDKTSVSK